MNVLLSAVGRRAYLVEYFKDVVRPLGGRVYATNTTPDATGFLAADESRIVPPSATKEYVDVMVALCKEWDVRLLFSLHDWDAPVLARAKDRFLAVGTIPVMGSPELLSICLDKYMTVKSMENIGVRCPKTVLSMEAALAQIPFPMIVKPRWGQGSLGLFKVDDHDELESAVMLAEKSARNFAAVCPEIDVAQPQIVIQEHVSASEYGCDIVNDLAGRFHNAFIKRKFAMRSGETDAAESVECPAIQKAARRIAEWSCHLGCMDSDWFVPKDGDPILIELNPRFGGGYPFSHCAGVDVPLACINWAMGKDNEDWCKNFRVGVRAFKDISMFVKTD
ncbi:MAG: ATP-grasp domain-containing protein [Kiritimatiellae bacterium]|nr:ATP-grasp domain-containing protein [Bacteroidales bacterium]MBR3222442.1 ATP-grasp domain-containing protein [Kiritimatiellia bacterium]